MCPELDPGIGGILYTMSGFVVISVGNTGNTNIIFLIGSDISIEGEYQQLSSISFIIERDAVVNVDGYSWIWDGQEIKRKEIK